MPTLTDLQQEAKQTLGGIASNTGVTPSTAQTASSLGAAPNSAQMAGTPAQQKASIKSALGTNNTLGELQRTATARVTAKQGQSQDALDKVQAAKELSGLGGKVGAATTAAVAESAKLPISVTANIDSYEGDPALKATLPSDLNALREAITSNDPVAQMKAWQNVKTKYNLTTDAVAKMFTVDPDALWGQLEKSITGTNVKMRDMTGVVDSSKIDAVKKLLPAEQLANFDNLTWQEAKALMNTTLDNATANVDELQKQATDATLPASTRSMAAQRLRELGVTGELQSAVAIQDAQAML